MLSPEDVQALAQSNRVAPHPAYHAHQHGVRFAEIIAGLRWCLRVEKDLRTDDRGDRSHPEGYIAWCPYKGAKVIRVDFTIQDRADGQLLLVVTAFEVSR